MGFMSLSPRYLVEVLPGLYLLAWDALRRVRLGPAYLLAGAAAGVALFLFMHSTGRTSWSRRKWPSSPRRPSLSALLLFLTYLVGRRAWAGAAAVGFWSR